MHLLPVAAILAAALSVASANHHLNRRHLSYHSNSHHLTGTIGHPTGIYGTAHPSGTGGRHHHHRNTTLITKLSRPHVSSTYLATTEEDPEVTGQAAGDETCTVTRTVKGGNVTHTVTVYENPDKPIKTGKGSSEIAQPSDTAGNSYAPPVLQTTTTDASAPTPPPATPVESSTSSSSSEEADPTIEAAAYGQNKQPQAKTTTTKTTAAVSSATPSTSPSTAPAPPGRSTGTGKRGLAFNDVNWANSFGGSGSQISWGYNWGNSCGGKLKSDFLFVPMLWGLSSEKTGGWFKAADAAIAAGASYLLGFNEPDHSAQANLSPAVAAAGYKTWMQPYAGKAKLGAPAVTNGGSPMGLTWLKSFLDACSGCTIDFVPIHWYDSATNIAYFKNHVKQAHDITGKQIWITEFAGSGSQDQQVAFLKEVMPWLDAQPYVERYSYFGVFDGSLVSGGTPSKLGSTFSSYTGS